MSSKLLLGELVMDSSIASSGCWRLLIAARLLITTLLLGGTALPLQAQNVIDGLPPPPNLPTIQPALPPEFTVPASIVPASIVPAPTLPAAAPHDRPVEGIPLQPQADRPSSAYLVYVDGDSPLLLAQVRRVESSAFVDDRDGEQVIQAGVFREENRAQQQILALQQQGIEAQMRRVTRSTPPTADRPDAIATNSLPPDLLPEVSVPQQVEFGQPLAPTAPASSAVAVRSSSYYVVVPGRRSNLPDIANLVTLLGGGLNVSEDEVQELGSPRGPHVLVGPFVDRRTASRWNRYFRDFGLDARVYYRR
ncbi:MAG: hypothetical protein HC895_04310 [Leptolyngbyaceae cyanobacterium SM1_3_5]|nr:hypothetical protein [Leptolyngbyaceae cyanobacterium SM1_3_5]